MAYKTDDADGILPVELHKAAIKFAKDVTGIERPTMENGIFIETFKACFQTMQLLGMVKDEFMESENPLSSKNEEE